MDCKQWDDMGRFLAAEVYIMQRAELVTELTVS
jgi:hypothetical protein